VAEWGAPGSLAPNFSAAQQQAWQHVGSSGAVLELVPINSWDNISQVGLTGLELYAPDGSKLRPGAPSFLLIMFNHFIRSI
jgi:hypothetical protein